MTVTKMDHALLSFAFLGNLSAPAKRNYGWPPPVRAVTIRWVA